MNMARPSTLACAVGRRAFTLVEVLIVIAIIGLLAAIMLLLGGQVREEANLVRCRSNLRGIGVAASVWAQDHDGAFPLSDVLDGPHPRLVAALAEHIGDPQLYYCSGETDPQRQYTPANVAAGRIGYFYFACEQAPTNRMLSTFLRWNVEWPRMLRAGVDDSKWLISDVWFSGVPTAHDLGKKATNYVTVSGEAFLVVEGPRRAFE